jgi:hypothetical protein
VIRWLLRLLGLGQPGASPERRAGAAAPRPAAKQGPPPVEEMTAEEFRGARRRVVAYVARSRVPLRQVVAARQKWLVDLSKVYEAIKDSPTQLVLERAGAVGENHEPVFRDALLLTQSIEPPLEAEAVHAALVGWITALHAACLALIDARKLRDRAMLGRLREQLGHARKYSATLVAERTELFTSYRLNVRPAVQRARRDAGSAPRVAAPGGAATRDHGGGDDRDPMPQARNDPRPPARPIGRRAPGRARRPRREPSQPRRTRTRAAG